MNRKPNKIWKVHRDKESLKVCSSYFITNNYEFSEDYKERMRASVKTLAEMDEKKRAEMISLYSNPDLTTNRKRKME